jgi:hypothetical protein
MSRGHGKWERLILQQLEKCEAFDLMDLLRDEKEAVDLVVEGHFQSIHNVPHRRTPSNVAALRRAAGNLFDARKVHLYYDWDRHHRLVITRPIAKR